MYVRCRVDERGRIVIPKEIRKALNIKRGSELVLKVENNRIIIEKAINPFKVLENILGEFTFSRGLRRKAEEEAFKQLRG